MTTQKITPAQIIEQVRTIEPAVSGCISDCGRYITGTYRGKSSNGYKFDMQTLVFVYNYAGGYVSQPYDKILKLNNLL